jgi:hypothetical protein
VTIPPFLPELDLAAFAPLPADQKRRALEGFKVSKPPHSYNPIRASYGDLMNLDTALFGALDPVPYERIATLIAARCKSQQEVDANLLVAAALYELRWQGRGQHFGPILTSIGQRLSYWTPVILRLNGRAVVPFINPRRRALPAHGERFVFSMMHEQIRIQNSDYAEVGLAICHFADSKPGKARPARLTLDDGVPLYDFDQLQVMVAETYTIWAEVHAGRVEGIRRHGSSNGTGFGF